MFLVSITMIVTLSKHVTSSTAFLLSKMKLVRGLPASRRTPHLKRRCRVTGSTPKLATPQETTPFHTKLRRTNYLVKRGLGYDFINHWPNPMGGSPAPANGTRIPITGSVALTGSRTPMRLCLTRSMNIPTQNCTYNTAWVRSPATWFLWFSPLSAWSLVALSSIRWHYPSSTS